MKFCGRMGICEVMDGRLQILLAILTVIGSGVSSGIVVYLLNARKEHVFFMINKVEETCSAATEYIHAVEEEAIFFESVFTNQDIKVKPEDLKLYPWNPKPRVYIRVYFPELFPQLAAMDVVALKVSHPLFAFP